MLIIQALRSDRIPAAALQFVTAVLGHDFIKVGILLRPPPPEKSGFRSCDLLKCRAKMLQVIV